MKREPLKFHIPEPKHRPGDEPDFSDIEIPAAGSLPPVRKTLRAEVFPFTAAGLRTGDRVLEIEGVLSGTLSYVMNRMRDGAAFSEAVRDARAAGLAEPDVRDDLSGRDVARKLALLAREVGVAVSAADVSVESLVPEGLEAVSLETFWERLPEADAAWQARIGGASAGEVQYVARLGADGAIRAGVESVRAEAGSLLAALRGSEIAVVVRTERTGDHPIFFQGPGASADVTAAVVLADVVRAAEAMR